jgi:hypothetical protein
MDKWLKSVVLGSVLAVASAETGNAGELDEKEDCGITPIMSIRYPSNMFADLHEQLTNYKQEDRRSIELQKSLKEGLDCLNRRLVDLRSLAKTANGELFDGTAKFSTKMDDIEKTLHEIKEKWPPTIQVSAGTSAVDAKFINSLVEVEKGEKELFVELAHIASDQKSRAPAALSTGAVITENFGGALDHRETAGLDQIDPSEPVLSHYQAKNVSVEIAIATVPDPRVPRHRRQYDNAITAVNQGMLRAGYVLDLYSFPWRKEIGAEGAAPVGSDKGAVSVRGTNSDASSITDVEHDYRFGLMLYRWDTWRAPPAPRAGRGAKKELRPGVAVRAVYIVPETGTYGVQPLAFRRAMESIGAQINATQQVAGRSVSLVTHPSCSIDGTNAAHNHASALVVFGPTFSGSVDSIREAIEGLDGSQSLSNMTNICMLSASATAATNSRGTLRYNRPFPCPTTGSAKMPTSVSGGASNADESIHTKKSKINSIQHNAVVHQTKCAAPAINPSVADKSPSLTISTPASTETNRSSTNASPIKQEETAAPAPGTLYYHSLATDDDRKIQFIAGLAESLGIKAERVVIVYEATVFGDEICKNIRHSNDPTEELAFKLCRDALEIAFPVNIADVRYGLRAKAEERQKERDKASSNAIFAPRDRLSLEDGAENGSEFPESQESPLTAASTELVLDRMIDAVKQKDPQLVIVVATDVRDRLFLIEKVGSMLSSALFIDLGADRLLGHPNFINATRGTIAISTAALTIGNCRKFDTHCLPNRPADYAVWSTDEQALLFRAITAWPGGDADIEQPPHHNALCAAQATGNRGLCPHIVTRAGLYSSLDFDDGKSVYVLVGLLILIFIAIGAFYYYYGSQGGSLWAQGIGWNVATILFILVTVAAALLYSRTTGGGVATFALGTVLAGLLFWPLVTGFYWPFIVSWASLVLLVAMLSLEWLYAFNISILGAVPLNDAGVLMRPLLDSLATSAGGGLAFPLAVGVACGALTSCVWISLAIAKAVGRSDVALQLNNVAASPLGASVLQLGLALSRPGAGIFAMGSILLILEVFLFWSQNAHRVTAFGVVADFSAFIAMVATTILSLAMFAGAIGMGSRLQTLSRLTRNKMFVNLGLDIADNEKEVLVWGNRPGPCPKFASTPVFASARAITDWPALKSNSATYLSNVTVALNNPAANRAQMGALYALFADEMFGYRLTIVGLIVCTLASSAIVYLFPVSHATPLIAINMLLLLGGGVYSAYCTVQFEGDLTLSSLLCNRKRERQWTWTLFASIVAPFVVLAIIVGVIQIPGVADAGGSVLDKLFGLIKLGGK